MEMLHQPQDIIDRRYRIVTPLGQGSMGTTYEAEDLTSYQRVAIKTVSLRQATDWKILELFEREGRVLANLNHPNIPNYLDYFYVDSSQDRIFYLVRELVGGDSLANLVQRGWNLEEERVKEFAVQVLQTLDYLHGLNPPIIHRYLKPENLIVDRSGKVFLVDFGAVADVYRQTISLSNTFVGTLGYMAPEQFRGQVKPASDLYSLGATLVFVLTGRSPVDLPQIRMKIDFKNLVSISPKFARWLDKMLEPMLEDRFTSAREALDAFEDNAFFRENGGLIESDRASSNIVNTRHPQPAGSKIVLRNNGTNLLIEIPTTRREIFLKSWSFVFILPLFQIYWLFIYKFQPYLISTYARIGSILVLAIYSFSLSLPYLIMFLGKTIVDIDENKLLLKFIFFSSILYNKEFSIGNVDRIGLSTPMHGGRLVCTVFSGTNTEYFGQYLSQIEKEWLVEEIQSFLNQIRP